MTDVPLPPGVHVPLITPFAADGSVATGALARLAGDVLAAGAAGIVALGTTAEASALDADERTAVIEVCARVCADRAAALTVGAGTNDTRSSAAALAGLARWPAVTAALVPVPYYVRPSPAGVIAHFTELAATSPVPLVVYHVPYRTGQELDVAALRALAALPGVVGVKYSTGRLDADAVDLLGARPAGFTVLAGDDVLFAPMLALGADGGILAGAHLATRRFVELAAAWRRGDLVTAARTGPPLARLAAAAFAAPNPTVIKAVLHAQGRIPTPDVRLPLLAAGSAELAAALDRLVELTAPTGVGAGG
jgi:4-hydroxy-tetrahydrodipicolinate synthase